MKKYLFLLGFVFLIHSCLFAQFSKGSRVVGGNFSMQLAKKDDINLFEALAEPNYGYFVTDKISLNGELLMGYFRHKRASYIRGGKLINNSFLLGMLPNANFYLNPINKMHPFFHGGIGYVFDYSRSYSDNESPPIIEKGTSGGILVRAGFGLMYMINENISLNGLLTYNYSDGPVISIKNYPLLENMSSNDFFDFSIGLNFFLTRNKK